jgi:hypothetical protein
MRLVKLVCESSEDAKFNSSETDILRLFEIHQLDPYLLGMISTDLKGFHRLDSPRNIGKSITLSYYLNCDAFKVIWAYDSTTFKTDGVIITRDTDRGRKAFTEFVSILSDSLQMISHPHLLLFVGIVQTTGFIETSVRAQRQSIRGVESQTGLHPWHTSPARKVSGSEEIEKLSDMSQHMSATLVQLEHLMHRVKQLQRAMTGVQNWQDLLGRQERMPGGFRHEPQSCVQSMDEALYVLLSRIDSTQLHIDYLRERAKNQLRVVRWSTCKFKDGSELTLADI